MASKKAPKAKAATTPKRAYKRQWRDYRTVGGARPVKAFLDVLTDTEVADILVGMKEVADKGLEAARHLRDDIYEVRVITATRSFRILFAKEGRYGQVLLSLNGFVKKTQATPANEIEVAEERLRDWRLRAAPKPKAKGKRKAAKPN